MDCRWFWSCLCLKFMTDLLFQAAVYLRYPTGPSAWIHECRSDDNNSAQHWRIFHPLGSRLYTGKPVFNPLVSKNKFPSSTLYVRRRKWTKIFYAWRETVVYIGPRWTNGRPAYVILWQMSIRTAVIGHVWPIRSLFTNGANGRLFLARCPCYLSQHKPNIEVSANVFQFNRADSSFAPSQWETALLRNDVSHWLGAKLESALIIIMTTCILQTYNHYHADIYST